MTKIDLTKQFFESLTTCKYVSLKGERDFDWKVKHSYRVADLAEEIAKKEGLDSEFSYVIGLLHDIGRFEQTREGFTFADDKSLDHGNFGAEFLEKSDFIKRTFSKKEANIIITAVKNHNKFAIQEGLDETTLTYCKMIRDADKVDILKYSHTYANFQNDELSPIVLEQYNNGEIVERKNIQTSQDWLVCDLALRFDINFASAKELAKPAIQELENLCSHKDKLKKF